MPKDTLIIIFAKFPAQGMAKTRLQPALGVAGAAQIARKLLLHSIEQAVATGLTVELCVSPSPSDSCWQTLNLPGSVQWSGQAEGDLGKRMLTASQQALAQFKQVILIGTDCPSLSTTQIRRAVRQLKTFESVIIPAFDGGYVLFGFKQACASLFSNIEWSTASVATVTQQRITALNWSLALLEPLNDIDEPADLKYLPVGWLDGYRVTNS
ncbi:MULTISPECIES: TIGR04282 family arsenosugar biosynthesis glycosyltransferase [unclassified Psychrobacter]|uniref:TIGR04282 family arsenosugar biosynthesis glycosyltransferase n=1 Tax=unclassified Psychrobacter TaxID=196806 RepID=UPI003F4800D5